MFLQQIINGISIGLIYALVSVGYSLIFGVLRMMNMAYASILTVGAHFCLSLVQAKFGFFPAIIVALVLTGLVSVFFDVSMLAPLRKKTGSDSVTVLITAIGFNYILLNLCLVIWGSERKPFQNVFDFGSLQVGSVIFDSSQIVIMATALVILAALTWVIYGSKIGLGMRAVQQNTKAANLAGVNTKVVITFSFFISGITACIAGFLIASYYQLIYPTMGVALGGKAFAAAVLGGIGVLHGSVIGGLIVGILECVAVYFFGGGVRDAVAYIILILVLLLVPSGLFGKSENTKV